MKIVIIGGVAAGASAAARARRLNEQARIVILERGPHISYASCGLPYHIGGVIEDRGDLLVQTPESLKASLAIEARVGHEATDIRRTERVVRVRQADTGAEYDEPYDYVILCPGATPIRPPLPGIDLPLVHVLRDVRDMDAIIAAVRGGARRAAVIGAGYIGVEVAENLRHRGLDVDLVEMADQVMPPLDREMAACLESHLAEHGVRLHLGRAATGFRACDGRIVVELGGADPITADLAILSVGVRPDTALARRAGLDVGALGGITVDRHMRTSDPRIYAAGDAVEVPDAVTGHPALLPLAGPASRQGRIAAENVCGRDTTYAGTQGTAIVKIFDMTAAMTGASEKALCRRGIPFRKVYVHPAGHAGYYPGTAQMHLKLIFAPEQGLLLGAQAVGYDGVDKRIDVLATAIRAKLTVYDLEQLELAYAPPYGSAKDPVNMAGFVAANLLRGDVAFWHSEDYPACTANGLVVDVRGPAEFASWHIPEARNIPLGKLRAELGSLPRDKPVYLYCKVGFRSYLAYRILRQSGFEAVATLAGGLTTFQGFHRRTA